MSWRSGVAATRVVTSTGGQLAHIASQPRGQHRSVGESFLHGRVVRPNCRALHNSWLRRRVDDLRTTNWGQMASMDKSQDEGVTGSEADEPPAMNEVDGFGRRLSDIDRQYAAQTGVERRIHIMGTGSIGKLVAHSLRSLPDPPPVTLIFHRYKLLEAWEYSKKVITIEDNGFDVARGGIDVELRQELQRKHGVEISETYETLTDVLKPHEAAAVVRKQQAEQQSSAQENETKRNANVEEARSDRVAPSNEIIHNLIITTKAGYTVPALLSIKHRLTAESTICFLQNGMGILDDVNKQIFPNPDERPSYIQGIITHGVNAPPTKAADDPFFAVHAGHGTISLGLMPRDKSFADAQSGDDSEGSSLPGQDEARPRSLKSDKWAPSARYILRTLTRSPILCAVGFLPLELFQLQLEKLAVNSVLNVLTALVDGRNGTVLYNFALTRTMRLMLAETSQVIRSLPELEDVPNVEVRFSADRLESLVVSVAHKTRDNISSMLADVRAGRRTEVDYINGYIVRRGEEIGIQCVVNYAMMQTVIGKTQIVHSELSDDLPVDKKKLNPD